MLSGHDRTLVGDAMVASSVLALRLVACDSFDRGYYLCIHLSLISEYLRDQKLVG